MMLMSRFLRMVLLADATATAATGVLLVAAAAMLESWLAIPRTLLFYAGLLLLPYAAFVYYLAAQSHIARSALWAVIACNAIWAVDSVLLLAIGWIEPSALGYAFVIGQAVVVAAFCELQFSGLRRATVQGLA